MLPLSQGQIVNADITDPRGQNRKVRPVVILTASAELSEADEFVVVAISHQLAEPLPDDWILLPWSSDGRARTGLIQPSVAKCRWIKKIRPEQVKSPRGWLSPT